MIAVDTNILVRHLTGDDAAQAEKVHQLLIGATGSRVGADTTWTFDRRAAKLPGFTLLR